jgi:hypothetical protein
MQRREYLIAAGGAVGGTALAGCTGGNGNGTDGGDENAGDTPADGNGGGSRGTLAMQVTDQPGDIGDFESCVVTITEVRVKPAGGDGGATATATSTDQRATDETVTNGTATTETAINESEDQETADADARGVRTHDVEDARADLVELQDGNTELVAELDLETGDYRFLQLVVSEVDATLEGGGEAEVTTPGNAPLKFNESFEIRADTRTVFTADFTPVKRGNRDSYLLKPVAEGTEVEYEDDAGSGTENGTATGTETATDTDEEPATATEEETATATTDA